MATISIENAFQIVQLNDGSIIKLRILDTAGQERYSAIADNYYRSADCCLLVYDITSRDSFNRVKTDFIPKIKAICDNIIKVVLLGNKTDLKNKREVEDIDGRDLALANGYIFMESSCKDNYNVSDAFTALVEMTNKEIINVNKSVNITLDKENHIQNTPTKKKRKC